MEKRFQFYGLDIMKFICALLVIMIHTAPLVEINETANFYLVQVIARIAVPFFFVASGFLFFMKLDRSLDWLDEENIERLKKYLKRVGTLYLVWSAVYLVYQLVTHPSNALGWVYWVRYIRDFLFTGSCYHLWFLPSLMVGIVISYFLFFNWKLKHVVTISILLYAVGMMINVYGDVLQTIPGVSTVYNTYINAFVTSRNGLFFAPLYLLMGAYFALTTTILSRKEAFAGLIISFILLCYEATMLKKFHYMNDTTSMYLFLVPLEFFAFSFVAQWTPKKRFITRFLRSSSLLIYVSHILFVYITTFVWQRVFEVPVPNLSLYVITVCCSIIFSIFCIYASKSKLKWLKVFY